MNVIRIIQLLGIAGLYLYFCRRLKIDPMPIKVPIFGSVRTFHEVRNIFDNFGVTQQLRDKAIEMYLSQRAAPCVIDCGVNVGVTARWWFHLNRHAKVFGIDMIDEAQEFTLKALNSIAIGRGNYTPIVTALWHENGKELTIGVGDPLYGDNGIYRKGKEKSERVVTTKTLDTINAVENIGEVDLLKVDLEGAGADALKGAAELLKKTKHVVIEIHSEEENKLAGQILAANKFVLRRANGRHLWWAKAAQTTRIDI
ncbi:MAG: FkbM family methyltransferase [Candidatus Omnitrophota bacterium]|nr:FkbM family methyltransferase [Candidatus Omnitrophota bacterium]